MANGKSLGWRFHIKRLMVRYSLWKRLALILVPHLSYCRDIYMREKFLVTPDRFPDACFDRKLRAAIHITALGADAVDMTFLMALMSPVKEFTYAEAEREAFAFLDKALLGQLATMPPLQRLQILQDQAERLSSEL